MSKQMKMPSLRFPEFSGEWEENKLERMYGNISSGKSKKSEEGNYNFYGSTGIIGTISSYNYEGEKLLVARVGAHAGSSYKVNGKYGVSDNTLIINNDGENSLNFLFFKLESFNLNKLIFGSGQPLITGGQLKGLRQLFPKLSEQTKIANFLSVVDNKIEQLNKKKNLLVQYKKGVMQQIFSQKLRFKPAPSEVEGNEQGNSYPDWEEKRLGEICTITTGNSNRVDSSLDGEFTFFDRSQDIRTSSIFLFDGEAIIVAGEGQEFIPKYFIGKFDLHQRTYAIMNFKENNGKLLYYFIDKNKHYFYSQAVGSTVKSLRLPMFQKMIVLFPCPKEQTKIANFLTAIDDKIGWVNTQIKNSQQFKKGLLQQLFV